MKRFLVILFLAFPAFAAQPYHLELSASPAGVFPYFGKFGDVDLHVYAGGVRADALWLAAFSRNGATNVTVKNPLARMYVEMPLSDIAPTLTKLAGAAGAIERAATPVATPPQPGKISGLNGTRYRLVYGPTAWIDVWTTNAIPENPQLRAIVEQLVAGISPRTAPFVKKMTGTPVAVTLNFRRFKSVELLKIKKLTFAKDDEDDALELGSLYMRAPIFEKLWQ
ncbi:MAG TPA: hypothetical protein VJZ00_14000 [Thermoanaerobaculia bacterium]|nr:hypothetical protein [Thermoanaerobaculia bacterium]